MISYDGNQLISYTLFELTVYFTEMWDQFVTQSMGWLIEQGFQILFWSGIPQQEPEKTSNNSSMTSENQGTKIQMDDNTWTIQNCKMFNTLMQFIDLVAMDPMSYEITPLNLVASCMYLMLGGKDVMGTFNFDYNLFP